MQWKERIKGIFKGSQDWVHQPYFYSIIIGFFIVFFSVWMIATSNATVNHFLTSIDNFMYDTTLKFAKSQSRSKHSESIVIVDIDERSLLMKGPWPWPRARFAELIQDLRNYGVRVIAFTIDFSAQSDTTASEYLKKARIIHSTDTELIKVLEHLVYLHEGDAILADTVSKKDDVVLGIIFNQYPNYSKGLLPAPAYTISNKEDLNRLVIPSFTGYSANYFALQNSTNNAGFATGIVDKDGIVRHAPLLITYNDGVYASLALEAVKLYLGVPNIEIQLGQIGDKLVVNAISLDSKSIYTDANGAILISYRIKPNYFTYISAADVLNHHVASQVLTDKLVFIGTTVSGLSDLRPTPLKSLFPNVEIQATIAEAILRNFIPYTPSWSKGAEILFTILLGSLMVFVLPFLRAIALSITLIILIILLIYAYVWLWSTYGLILSFSVPIFMSIFLVILNSILGFLFESRRREFLYETFTKYVPPEHVKEISKGTLKEETKQAETRTVTILFSDIRHFTEIAEKLSDTSLRIFLNQFYTFMTEIILKYHGTVDKFVGDMIMAFWGAPGEDALHRQHALDAALEMQKKIILMEPEFSKLNLTSTKIGIGINTGEVSLGEIGSEIRRSYTIIGDTVNLASRIESLTKFYHAGIIIGENTYLDCKDQFIFRHLDRIQVKGRHTPVEIYQLICKTEDAEPALLQELKLYQEALEDYYQQRWQAANAKFTNLINLHPHVKVYSIFLKRIQEFMFDPPGENWDGTYVRTKK